MVVCTKDFPDQVQGVFLLSDNNDEVEDVAMVSKEAYGPTFVGAESRANKEVNKIKNFEVVAAFVTVKGTVYDVVLQAYEINVQD